MPAEPVRRPVVGIVEEFTRRLVVGWIQTPASAPPTRVDLYLGDLLLSSTYATADAPMSGVSAVQREDDAEADVERSAELAHHWQVPPIPGPEGDRRNGFMQIRTFSFRVRGIWPYVGKRTKITLKVGKRNLPISGHGMYLLPPKRGGKSLAELEMLLDQGHVLGQKGRIQLSKKADTTWQRDVMDLYDQVRRIVAESHGYDLFLIYGTLLGVVREGGFIGHDMDFDSAYLSQKRTGPEAAAELADLALVLIEHDLEVEQRPNALHVSVPGRPDQRIDVFHTYFNEDGVLRLPFGVAGTTVMRESDWQGTKEIEFAGGRGLVPAPAEAMVELLYGSDWAQPKPGFNWNLARTDSAPEGAVPPALITKVYWANFYAHHSYTSASTFFEFVQGRDDTPDTVVDIGCGDGRDAFAFAAAGRVVVGLDQSPVGIEHASSRAVASELGERLRFRVCDVGDAGDLASALDESVTAGATVLFYLRFFLHAITEVDQKALLDSIGAHANAGDVLAAEFRTDKDEANAKVHENHYRRFQNADAFVADLEARGWTILHSEESAGLSPYQDEDPILCRVVARRSS